MRMYAAHVASGCATQAVALSGSADALHVGPLQWHTLDRCSLSITTRTSSVYACSYCEHFVLSRMLQLRNILDTCVQPCVLQQTVVTVVQFDALSQPYASQRNAAWRAYVADSFPAVFARLAADVSHGSATEVSDPTLAADHTASEHSPRVLLSESEAASIREKVLTSLTHFPQPGYPIDCL